MPIKGLKNDPFVERNIPIHSLDLSLHSLSFFAQVTRARNEHSQWSQDSSTHVQRPPCHLIVPWRSENRGPRIPPELGNVAGLIAQDLENVLPSRSKGIARMQRVDTVSVTSNTPACLLQLGTRPTLRTFERNQSVIPGAFAHDPTENATTFVEAVIPVQTAPQPDWP